MRTIRPTAEIRIHNGREHPKCHELPSTDADPTGKEDELSHESLTLLGNDDRRWAVWPVDHERLPEVMLHRAPAAVLRPERDQWLVVRSRCEPYREMRAQSACTGRREPGDTRAAAVNKASKDNASRTWTSLTKESRSR